jgi:hypothetical protein
MTRRRGGGLVVVGLHLAQLGCAPAAETAPGDELWEVRFPGPVDLVDRALTVAAVGDSEVVVGGYESVAAERVRGMLRRVGSNGDVEIDAAEMGVELQDRWVSDVAVGADGRIVAVGGASVTELQTDLWIQVMDAQLRPLWSQTWAGAAGGPDEAVGVAMTGSGEIFVVGYESRASDDTDVVELMFAADGTIRWETGYAGVGAGWDAALEAAVWDGDPVVVGYASEDPDDFETDPWVRRHDPDGGTRWTFTMAREGIDRVNAVTVLEGGELLVGGFSCEPGRALDAWWGRFSATGNLAWEERRDGPGGFADSVAGLAATPDGGWLSAGFTFVEGEAFDAWTEAAAADGSVSWGRIDGGPAGGDDQAAAVARTGDGSVWVAGSVTVSGSGADADIDGFLRRIAG